MNDSTKQISIFDATDKFAEMWRIAEAVSKSDMIPSDYRGKPANIIVAVQKGRELGLDGDMQALESIAVVNGRARIFGDAIEALCMKNPSYVDCIVEKMTDEQGNLIGAKATAKRKGRADKVATFTLEEARKAKLFDKKFTPWETFPWRMLQARARTFALRDQFPDALMGMHTVEEMEDVPEINVTPHVVVATDEPKADPAPMTVKEKAKAKKEEREALEPPQPLTPAKRKEILAAMAKAGVDEEAVVNQIGRKPDQWDELDLPNLRDMLKKAINNSKEAEDESTA